MGTGASRRKLIKAKINLFSVEYRVTEKRGGSLSIFAVLTARTLYTYKYEVAINNDKVHRPASSFLSLDLLWSVTFCRVSRAPARVAPVGPPPGRPTCPAGRRTLDFLRTQVSRGTRCYERPGCWWPPWLGTVDAFPNPWKVGIGAYSPRKVGIGASGNPSFGFLTRNLD